MKYNEADLGSVIAKQLIGNKINSTAFSCTCHPNKNDEKAQMITRLTKLLLSSFLLLRL